MDRNFLYISAHIGDYIKNENLFDTFNMVDIKTIMKCSCLTADQYVTLLKQFSSTINTKELYMCTRKTRVHVQNLDEVVSILNSLKKYMKFNIFDGIVDFLKRAEKASNDSTKSTERLQDKSKEFQN
ncbi:hypothetical protein TVAG_202880 [Trichomonas vaginalis G3]|uniref:Uncharacterized protein n=1 Tax=Trichomonas vaginalis (strain ATCC PRA-98 / G3) TaxID=412133 RepID=A2ENG0_TRIV3|nr:hypothetical protein TVAG_202880 [Trichomonas vaginalis G3]|eukprot:XP_001318053.1 hypothetical protein [Trichomonas vaginalis G3]